MLAALALVALGLLVGGCGDSGLGDDARRTALIDAAERPRAASFRVPALRRAGEVTLASHRGRPVLVNFWASWCAPCRRETPELVRFAKAHPGIDVIGLAVEDGVSASRAFARRYAVPYELGVDRNGAVSRRFEVPGLPTTVLIDSEGRTANTWPGEIGPEDLEAIARQLGV